ncbi:MAG: hypothetical protein EBZ24_08985 [Synechococcaceae bacterium WB9_4xB_025]|nr:hypothetical protein [Synechococcaceae bacterium WB9_4xB_025]
MTSAQAMRLKLLLKDDTLLQQELSRCSSPDEVIAFLLRMEALMTLTLTDEQLNDWYTTPYWKRVLTSLGAATL